MASRSGSLPRYILQRVLLIIPMVWILLTMVFLLMRVAPGDPVSASLGGRLTEEAMEIQTALIDSSLGGAPLDDCMKIAQSMERIITALLKEDGEES